MQIKALRRRQAGLTLVEVLLVLAIAAVAIVGGTVLFGQASDTQKTTQTMNDLNALAANVKTLFNTQADYGAANTNLVPSLAAADKIPANMRTGANLIQDQYGGNVTVISQQDAFEVTMPAIPQGACVTILTTLGSTASAGNLDEIRTDSQTYTVAGGDFPLDVTESTAACPNSTNQITISYR